MLLRTNAARARAARRFGRYWLLERIGCGAVSEVWKARVRAAEGDRLVVLKRVRPELGRVPGFASRFLAEARLAARLHHPNLVAVLDLGQIDGQLFLAMEHVRGYDLNRILRAQMRDDVRHVGLAALVARDLCRALGYTHAHEADGTAAYVHRDVRPANVMVAVDGTVKLLDLAVARASGRPDQPTAAGQLAYLSPELVDGLPVDQRSDLFAAGIVLHEALTGRRLFKCSSELKTLAAVRAAEVPAPSSLNPDVPPELDEVCARALARDRERRYADGEEMARDLDRVVRALGWERERVAAVLRALFADDPPEPALGRTPATLPGLEESGLGPATPDDAPPPRVAAGPRRWLMAGVAALGGCALLALVVERGPHAASAPPAAALAASTVEIALDSQPSGATVFVDGERAARGVTPLRLALPRAHPVTLTLEHDGYLAERLTLRPERNQALTLPLPRPRPTLR